MLMGFYSIIFSCRRLGRPGVSKEMRKLFVKKHALYVIALIIIWLVQLLFNYYELFKPRQLKRGGHPAPEQQARNAQIQERIETVSFIAVFLTGIVMVLIRTLDPYYMFLLSK